MPRPKYLLCPQCGSHRYFVDTPDRGKLFFHVDWDKQILPTQESNADLSGVDTSIVFCSGCSWKGPVSKLKKYFI